MSKCGSSSQESPVRVKSSIVRRKYGTFGDPSAIQEQVQRWQQESSALPTSGREDVGHPLNLQLHRKASTNQETNNNHYKHKGNCGESHHEFPPKMKLMTYTDLPDWMKDNDYIKRGYRPQLSSFTSCLKSIFTLHTETGNIWTHLVGCSIFVVIACYTLYMYQAKLTISDIAIFSVYFLSIISCLAFSTIYHIFTCHSEDVAQFCKRIDYCGISLLITGSIVSWTYYAFYHDTISKTIYLTIVTIIGLIVSIVSFFKKFGSSEFRSIRTIIYIVFGVSATLPVIHYFFSQNYVEVPLFPLFSFGAFYILGAVFYATRIPEKFSPGRFDIVLHSHQIFHILVVVAAWVHLANIREIAFKRIE